MLINVNSSCYHIGETLLLITYDSRSSNEYDLFVYKYLCWYFYHTKQKLFFLIIFYNHSYIVERINRQWLNSTSIRFFPHSLRFYFLFLLFLFEFSTIFANKLNICKKKKIQQNRTCKMNIKRMFILMRKFLLYQLLLFTRPNLMNHYF